MNQIIELPTDKVLADRQIKTLEEEAKKLWELYKQKPNYEIYINYLTIKLLINDYKVRGVPIDEI